MSTADCTTCALVNKRSPSMTNPVPVAMVCGKRCHGCQVTRATSIRTTPRPWPDKADVDGDDDDEFEVVVAVVPVVGSDMMDDNMNLCANNIVLL
jgi:hypothetical protein